MFNIYSPQAQRTLVNIRRDETEVNSPMFNCFDVIFRGEYHELQNNGLLKHKTQTQLHACGRSFNDKLTYTSIVNQFTPRVRQ